MSRPTPQAASNPTPNPVPVPSKSPSFRRSAWSAARVTQFQEEKQRKTLLRQRTLLHLQEVERLHQGKKRRSIRLYIKRCNLARGPETKPFCSCVLFGEEDYFINRTDQTGGPPEGFRIVVHDGENEPDSEDLDTNEEDNSDNSSAEEELFRQVESNISSKQKKKSEDTEAEDYDSNTSNKDDSDNFYGEEDSNDSENSDIDHAFADY